MSRLTFTARLDGLAVDVLIGLDGRTTTALHLGGQPIPPPLRASGVIDTGSDISAVSSRILRHFVIPVHRQGTTHTAAGLVGVDLYKVSVGITDFADPNAPELVEPNLIVMELPAALPSIDVLIGLDLLMNCNFHLDGPGKQFSLQF
ncbi:MAG: hypothetical protein JNM56_26565 [Planctomycetia bacterium]|nr:hypothetical protein [Planctomycetia bacterium]